MLGSLHREQSWASVLVDRQTLEGVTGSKEEGEVMSPFPTTFSKFHQPGEQGPLVSQWFPIESGF